MRGGSAEAVLAHISREKIAMSDQYKINPTGLSEAGRRWLQNSTALPTSGLGDIDHLLRSVARTFGITTRESMISVCSALSAMIGHSVLIQGPSGSIMPCSLQLLIASDSKLNVFGAAECLGENVIEFLARMLGRRRVEPPKEIGEPALKLLNLRRQQIFPVGDLLTADLAKKLIEEDGEAVFGSLSYELALAEFLRMPPKEAQAVESFVSAGWRGSMVPGVEGHPVYPTVSVVWGASSGHILEAVQRGILDRLPGLMIVKPKFLDSDQTNVPDSWPDSLRKLWVEMFMRSFKKRMTSAPRHADPDGPMLLMFDERAGQEVASLSSFQSRYTQGSGPSSRLLRHAPHQVAKIAGLLTIAQSLDEINLVTVEFAKEIYRGLCHDTLAAVDEAFNASPDSDVGKRRRVLEKLRIQGALSLKDLASTYPKLPFEDLPRVVLSMVDEGVIENVDGTLRVPVAESMETKKGADEAGLVTP